MADRLTDAESRRAGNPRRGPTLAERIAFLRRPETYPEPIHHVETKETHMSWVFLTDRHAWKMKKPVRSPYLDFSTVGLRRRDCQRELRLNRRLAPGVYLGIVPLAIDPDGRLALGGDDGQREAVDWLVKMRRLPADRMLDRAIEGGEPGVPADEDVRRAAERLARFYERAVRVDLSPEAYRARIEAGVRANHTDLTEPRWPIVPERVWRVTEAQLNMLRRDPDLFHDRARRRWIVDAHGDLRPEHICLTTPEPVIIDCLEFNRDLRVLDAASELSFLALECERLGAPRIGDRFLTTCRDLLGDHPPDRLIAFYKSCHACVRARIALWHLDEPGTANPEKWSARAAHYLDLAARHLRSM